MTGRFVIAMAIGAVAMFVAIESQAKCCKFERVVPVEQTKPGLLQTPRK
jgi:hypothetical protein